MRGRDLEMFYLGYSESGQRLDGYSIDKVQQSRKGKKGKPMCVWRGSRLQQRTVLIHPRVEEEAIKTA